MEPETTAGPEAEPSSGPARRLSRRSFLVAGGAGALGAAALGATAWRGGSVEAHLAAHGLNPSSTAGASDGPILVLLTLYGGNDGLNTVVPYEDPDYTSARGALALAPGTALPLADGFGLHPSMPGFQKLFKANQLAVVQGVGYPNPNLSHFASMDIWQSAMPDGDQSSGWVGRWLDATGTDPLRATSIGPTLPLALMGSKVQGAAVPPPPLTLPGSNAQQSAYVGMEVVADGEPGLLADVARSGSNLLAVQRTLAPVLDSAGTGGSGSSGGTNLEGSAEGALAITQGGGGRSTTSVLSQQLDLVTKMIEGGVPTKVYAVSFGGFDTHTDETATQKALLGELDQAVSGFLGQVATAPHNRPVVVLVHSEFGRRVAGNASGGTDHGTANVVFMAGSMVKGGLYGDPPSLTKLDENENLVFTMDFRSVYATVLSGVIGVDPKNLLGGSFSSLPILA
ncbi:MAG: DUF1501 domain-containing protein [Acidimicrobiales bacterium]